MYVKCQCPTAHWWSLKGAEGPVCTHTGKQGCEQHAVTWVVAVRKVLFSCHAEFPLRIVPLWSEMPYSHTGYRSKKPSKKHLPPTSTKKTSQISNSKKKGKLLSLPIWISAPWLAESLEFTACHSWILQRSENTFLSMINFKEIAHLF